ncbi:Influenza virus NS1A-binding protein [Armadillidium vulgare]|nr:Influenza virus NS1A-binding protein [Armadillidium vulgare]
MFIFNFITLAKMVTEGRREEVLIVSDSAQTFCSRMRQLQHLRKNRTFCDVVLQVENSEIYAHRSVLACASPYFFELFTADDDLIYKLNGGFDRDSVERLVSYAYTGELEVSAASAKSMYIAAYKLKMNMLG